MKLFQYILNPLGRASAKITIRVSDGRAYIGFPGCTQEAVVVETHPIDLTISSISPEQVMLEAAYASQPS